MARGPTRSHDANRLPDRRALTAAIVCHARFLDLAAFEETLRASGYRIRYFDAACDGLTFDPVATDLVVVLGGPIGAYQLEEYPFISDEMAILQRRAVADRPTLAICLGAQILAQALGARVYPGQTEIGWAPITLTDAGERSVLRDIGRDQVPVLHWHGDTFDLPSGAEQLASTADCENQAFSVGAMLAVQFHPEVSARHFERWLICNAGQIALAEKHTVQSLREQATRYADAAALRGQEWLARWLAQVVR
jgi:GMP synthase (glutamine-hydrolysing)